MTLRHLFLAMAFVGIPSLTLSGECGASGCSADSSCSECCQECQTCTPSQTYDSCQQCQTCESSVSGCLICGGQGASSCCAVSIDVDSLKDDAQSKKLYDAQQARLIFKFPDDKYFVYLSDRQMNTPGKIRNFTIPVGDQEKKFNYEVKVDRLHHGQMYHKKQTLKTLRAGSIIAITVGFLPPNEEEGLPADITFELEPRALGGDPEGDEAEGYETKE
jgi:hypothetical protein